MPVDGRTAAAMTAPASVAVIVALGAERTSLQKQLAAGPTSFTLLQSGPGAERAARAATTALAAGAHALVAWGLAGGLADDLAPGSVVLPRRVRTPGGESFAADPEWHAALERALRGEFAPRVEDLVTVPAALTTAAEKHAASLQGAVAADMESAAIAAVAARARAPFVALRVIVDAARDALPADAERWIDERGARRFAPALAAAFQPGQWRELWILAQRFRAARRTLESLAAAVAASGFCLTHRS
jgi:adenosylhomocysteine nucleosidase